MTQHNVAILHVDRAGSFGGDARVQTWRALLEAAGFHVDVVPMFTGHRSGLARARGLPDVFRGRAVPESVVWNLVSVRAALDRVSPTGIVAVTARAFVDELAHGPWIAVLDFVDRLSVSYRVRTQLASDPLRRAVFRGLARTHDRFERRLAIERSIKTVAAGRADADALGARWIPNIISQPLRPRTPGTREVDVLFFGNLSYPPNIDAIHRLGRAWPSVARARPATTCKIAGRNVGATVRRLADRYHWLIEEDFPAVGELCATARIAVAPIRHASGMQNKVLEAAACGIPQVVDRAVLAGLSADFPLETIASEDELAPAILRLLADETRRRALGEAAQQHVARHYLATQWADDVKLLFDRAGAS
ncbi:MAG: glycosyltransferase [Acidimicrobiia bacterium]